MSDYNARFEFKDIPQSYALSEPVHCTLCITPQETTRIDQLTCILAREIRGLLPRNTSTVDSFTIEVNDTLYRGETYEYPIVLKNHHSITYKGNNISQTLFLQIYDSEAVKEDSVLMRIKSIFVRETPLYFREVVFNKGFSNYSVSATELTLYNKFWGMLIPIVFGSFFLGVITYTQVPKMYSVWVLGGLASIVVMILLFQLFLELRVGKTRVEILDGENNQFLVKIFNSKEWRNSSEIEVYYTINEVVRDDRGTTTTYHRTVIHTSKIEKIETPKNGSGLYFELPTTLIPEDNEIPDLSFTNTLHLAKNTWFGKRNYMAKFNMIRNS